MTPPHASQARDVFFHQDLHDLQASTHRQGQQPFLHHPPKSDIANITASGITNPPIGAAAVLV